MKLLLLTPEEKETITLRREKSGYFRLSGDESAYMLPPCIILGEGGNYDARIEIPEHFRLGSTTRSNRFGSYLVLEETERLHAIQRELGLEEMDTGLFLSLRSEAFPYSTSIETLRIKYLEEVILEENTMKTVRRRPLRRF